MLLQTNSTLSRRRRRKEMPACCGDSNRRCTRSDVNQFEVFGAVGAGLGSGGAAAASSSCAFVIVSSSKQVQSLERTTRRPGDQLPSFVSC